MHHFYLTFRNDCDGVVIPARLLARYPHEMTIVLQHQFWDLKVDREARQISVGLSFGGAGSILVIPFGAMTGFADPHAQFQLQFEAMQAPAAPEPAPGAGTRARGRRRSHPAGGQPRFLPAPHTPQRLRPFDV